MSTVSVGTLRYDIVSDTTSFVRGMRATRNQLRMADQLYRRHRSPIVGIRHEMQRLATMRQRGMISARTYRLEMRRLNATMSTAARTRRLNISQEVRMRAALRGTHRTLRPIKRAVLGIAWSWERAGRSRDRYMRRGPERPGGGGNAMANFGGSLGSAMGFGGAGAGAGRLAGMGGGFMAFGALALGASKAITEFAQLESATVDLQVIMGDVSRGNELVDNLRDIAKETPLTTKQLIKNAQTMVGYGLSTKGLEDRLRRLGEVAGGDTMRFESLTRAFAQVQSAGKLMGQELLQLVNAGYPIAAVAKAAGVSMSDFRDEMEAGNISAGHLQRSLTALTSEGGLMYDRLNKQANTLNGMWVRMTGEMEKNFAASGENMRSLGVAGIETLRGLGEAATDVLNGFDDIATGLADLVDDAGNAKRKMGDQSWWSRLRTGVITGTTMMYMDLTGQHDEFMEYAEQSAEIQRESERRKNQIAADKAVQDAKDAEDAMLEAEAEGYRKKIKKDMEAHQKSLDSKLSLEDQYQKEYAELTSKYMLWSAQDKFDAEMALRDKYDALIKEREDNARAERLKKDKEGLRELYEETSRWEEKQLADAKKANDEKLKEIDAKAKDDLQGFDQSNKASASFAAGSVEEYNLRRDMQLASRREAKEDAVNAAAQASRDQANRQLDALNRNIKAQADNERSAIQTTLAVIN